ncbi:phosphotransferase [Streptomyces sclerotialus]|uniref:phosphotransferase n=1 Tax=Streptomyces sclerotialus TaxID=1957 RepID=UPI000AD0EE93
MHCTTGADRTPQADRDRRVAEIGEVLAVLPLPRCGSSPPRRSLLHTEVMREHFLVDPDGWRLTGLLDFEPAMIGDRAYGSSARPSNRPYCSRTHCCTCTATS